MTNVLSEVQIMEALQTLPSGWEIYDGKLHRDFEFKDFNEAFGFMTRVATIANELNHHPDWSNSYRKVSIDLFTHDLGGISDLDIELARRIG